MGREFTRRAGTPGKRNASDEIIRKKVAQTRGTTAQYFCESFPTVGHDRQKIVKAKHSSAWQWCRLG